MPLIAAFVNDVCARGTMVNDTFVWTDNVPCTGAWDPLNFLTILVLVFAFFLLLTGGFTAYFGSGKSRKVGSGLLAGGLALGLVWVLVFGILDLGPTVSVGGVVIESIGVLLAALVGAAAAIGLFLLAIMKS